MANSYLKIFIALTVTMSLLARNLFGISWAFFQRSLDKILRNAFGSRLCSYTTLGRSVSNFSKWPDQFEVEGSTILFRKWPINAYGLFTITHFLLVCNHLIFFFGLLESDPCQNKLFKMRCTIFSPELLLLKYGICIWR